MKIQNRKSNGTNLFTIKHKGRVLMNGLFRNRQGWKLHRSGKIIGFTNDGDTFNQFHVGCFTLGIEKKTPARFLWNWAS